MLSGPLKGVQKEPANVQLCIEEEDERLNERVNELWDLETIDIKEEDSVYESLIDDISFTTKVRIVYDGSAKQSKSSISLNESLQIGAPRMPLMYDGLLRLRCYNTALIGDIQKAFLSIEVDERD